MTEEQQLKTILVKLKQGKLSINVAKEIIISMYELSTEKGEK